MKPENKIPVLARLSDEMKAVVNFQQPGLPPWPADGDIETQRQYYLLERRFWNADAPPMATRTCAVPTPYGDVTTRLYSPQARYPQAIEETVAVCRYFSQHADKYSLNVEKIGFAGDSAGAMLALASAIWLRDKHIRCGNVIAILLWYGLYGLQDSVSRRLFGGAWDGLTREDLDMYEKAYLRNEEDRESPWYCLFNNDLTRNVPPCFIASAEFDPLIDDSRLLHQTLQAHRQPCEYKMYPGTLHAFLHYSRMMTSADDALQDGARFFMARIKTPR
ncbi:alpha/beta hydrolase fold domain-containing protein [Salmonella enterica]|nr:alpha/beta hydrolase fold domain-containing protein [Salmonella enterica]